ncbi:SCO family protein [Bacillus dakarensis]|uniref:SCO family protein n=1 Tax=Robertmurraya dakarensis TaxID=1926278 RepID=UPI00098215F0|nr:SCO family protein [Bacillus dakarensis]
MKKLFFFLLVMFSLLIISACSNENQAVEAMEDPADDSTISNFVPDYDWPIADFEAVNQENETIMKDHYDGDVWIMNMIFTNCETICLPMTANMAKLQQQLESEGLNVQLVSFSVDPLFDTPEVLTEYGKKYEADFSNWDFLTGYTGEDIRRIAKSVKTLAEKPEGTDQVTHSTKFFLVNQQGIAVKGYDGVNLPIEQIIQDLKSLQ